MLRRSGLRAMGSSRSTGTHPGWPSLSTVLSRGQAVFPEYPDPAEPFEPPVEQVVLSYPAERLEVPENRLLERGGAGRVITMGPAHRLGQDAVDHAQPLEVGGGELERFGGHRRLLAVAPQDRRTT